MVYLSEKNEDQAPITCGSGLAREGISSVDKNVECAAAFASKPAPTGFSGINHSRR
jgi:hypothetical protein